MIEPRLATLTGAIERLAAERAHTPPGARRAQIAFELGRALRDRYAILRQPGDLEAALETLEEAEAGLSGEPRLGAAADLAGALYDLATLLAAAGGAADAYDDRTGAPVTADTSLARAAELAARVREAAPAGSDLEAEATAVLGRVRGMDYELHGSPDAIDEAIALLARAAEHDPPPDRLVMLAKYLTVRARGPDDEAAARDLLEGVATAPAEHPLEAFEAARYHGYWAAERGAWAEAGAAFRRALAAREQVTRLQADWPGARGWLAEASTVPADAAYAIARAGDVAGAAAALDAGLATLAAKRLGAGGGGRRTDPAAAATVESPVVLVAATLRGGFALVRGDAWRAVWLPELTSHALYDVAGSFYRARPQPGDDSAAGEAWLREVEALCGWLWSVAMQPVVAALDGRARALTVIADGVLAQLPLHAARPADGAPGVLDRLTVRYAPSCWMLERAAAAAGAPADSILAVADPGIPPRPPLKWAFTEASLVASGFPRRDALFGGRADVDGVSAALAAHGVVHFACHGVARLDDPLQSALLLRDGQPLTLARLLNTTLRDTRLVVLSACDTAQGDVAAPGEKISLPSGLLEAGAAGVVASLWQVDDRATMLLMARFHELWSDRRDAPQEALRAAQRWLRDATTTEIAEWIAQRATTWATGAPRAAVEHVEHALDGLARGARPFSSPYYWAPFGYVGA